MRTAAERRLCSGSQVGEYAAAVVAGTMSLVDGLRLVLRRAQLIDEKCAQGVVELWGHSH